VYTTEILVLSLEDTWRDPLWSSEAHVNMWFFATMARIWRYFNPKSNFGYVL